MELCVSPLTQIFTLSRARPFEILFSHPTISMTFPFGGTVIQRNSVICSYEYAHATLTPVASSLVRGVAQQHRKSLLFGTVKICTCIVVSFARQSHTLAQFELGLPIHPVTVTLRRHRSPLVRYTGAGSFQGSVSTHSNTRKHIHIYARTRVYTIYYLISL